MRYTDILKNGKYNNNITFLGNMRVKMIDFMPKECPAGYTPEYDISKNADLCSITYRIEAPMATAIQILKYGITNFKILDRTFSCWDITESPRFKNEDKVKKSYKTLVKHQKAIYILYKKMVKDGCDKDIAKFVLPMSEMVIMYATFKIKDLLTFLNLYDRDDTKIETREIARVMHHLAQPIFPKTFKKYVVSRKNDSLCVENKINTYKPPKLMPRHESGLYNFVFEEGLDFLFKIIVTIFILFIVKYL